MVDRKVLWTVIFCTAEILGGCIALILLPFNVLLALAVAVVISVCMIIFSLYMALGDNSKKDNRSTTRELKTRGLAKAQVD